MKTTDQKIDDLSRQIATLTGMVATSHEVLTRTETRLCAFAQFAGASHIGSPPKNAQGAKPSEGGSHAREN